MRKGFIIITFIFFSIVWQSAAQQNDLRIAIISDIDTNLTHLYEAKSKYDNKVQTYPFDLKNYIIDEFERVIDTLNLLFGKNYQVKEYPLPDDYKKASGLLNFFNKPNNRIKKHIEKLAAEEQIDYAIIFSFSPLGPESENAHLNPHDYGVCSYQSYGSVLTYFTLFDFFLFQAAPLEMIDFDYPTELAKDLKYFDFIIEKKLSLEERQNLPAEHLKFTEDMIKEMAGIKIEKLLRVILQRLAQNNP